MVVVIKPKEGSTKNAREELKKKINRKNMNFSKVIQGKDGIVTVVLKDDASLKLLKENAEKAMGDQFEVNVRNEAHDKNSRNQRRNGRGRVEGNVGRTK